MAQDDIYSGLATRFLHDGCHNRAEAICRRLSEQGCSGVGKYWILPSNFRYGRISIPNPLIVPWLHKTVFCLPDVEYRDSVYIHGEEIQWRYHVLAATQDKETITVYDSATGTHSAADYLSFLTVASLDENAYSKGDLISCFTPFGQAPKLADFSAGEQKELLREIESDCPQRPDNWTDYWLNSPKSPGFSVDAHHAAVNAWHIQIERLLVSQAEQKLG